MASYNRIVMIGNLTRDPEYKQLPSGSGICRLGLASNRQYRNKQSGELVQEVCFVDIDIFGPQAESCNQYLQKGRPILVEGRLKFDSWDTPDGQKRSKHCIVADRVVFLSGPSDGQGAERNTASTEVGGQLEKEFFGGAQPAQEQDAQEVAEKAEEPKEAKKPASKSRPKADEDSSTQSTGEFDFKDEPPFQDDLPF